MDPRTKARDRFQGTHKDTVDQNQIERKKSRHHIHSQDREIKNPPNPMDHHHLSSPSFTTARYAPPPPPPPPPFSGDPNFRSSPNHHHHQHHLPPPPYQPLPPPPYQPLPPPPTYRPNPYNPQNPPPQFNFSNPNPNRPIDDDDDDNRPRSFPRRLAFQDNGRSYHESRPDHRPARPYPGPVDLDRHGSFRPSPPARRVEIFRREPEGGGSRVRDEVGDQHSQRDKYGHGHVWGQSDGHRRGGASDRTGGSFGFNDEHGSSSSRGGEYGSSGREIEHGYSSSRGRVLRVNSGSYSGKYELISDSEMGRSVRDEGQRWVQNRQPLKDGRGPSFEMGHSEANGGYGVGGRVFSRKEEYNGPESGRYTESVHGYVDQPRKQVQKKSALLRIQMVKPNHKNRDGEHSHYSGYYGDSNVSSIRGKDQLGYSGRGREKEEEEGSPVELDVSFKSNSLVAKPIATPPSSKVVSDANVMPRSSKIRKIAKFDRECSSSPLTKSNENASRSDSVRSVVNNSPSSGKDLKQLEKKAPASGSLNTSATSSQPCCDGKNDSIAKAQVERSLEKGNTDKSGANAASGKKTIRKIVKKKIIVKRIRRKDMTPSSRLSSSQLAKKGEEPVVPDSSTAAGSNQHLKDSKEDQILTSVHRVDLLQPGLKKVTVPSEGNKVGGSPQAIVSEERDNFVIPLGGTRDASTSLASLDHEIKIDEHPTSADASGYHLHNIVNFGDHLNSQIETTCSDGHSLENVGKQISDSGDSILLENGGEKESQDIMFSVEGNVTSGLSCSGDMRINSVSMNIYNPSHKMNKDLGFDIGGVSLAEKTAHLDICTVFDSQQLHTNDAPTILHNDSVEALPTSIATIGIKDNAATSSSVETTIHNERVNADCSGQRTDTLSGIENGWTYLEDIATSNNGTADDVCKKLSSNGVTPSLEDDAIKGSPNTEASEGGSKIDISESKKKRKVETSQLDLSSSSRIDEYVGVLNPFNLLQASDLTFPFNDANPAEVTVSGFDSLLVNSQPNSTSGISVLNGNISMNASSLSEVSVKSGGSVDLNIISSNQKNKQKISVLHPGLSVNEESLITYSCRPGKEVFAEFNNGQNQEQTVAASDFDPTYAASSPPSWKRTTLLVEPNMLGGAFNIVSPVRDALKDDSSEIELPNSVTCSAVQEMAIPNLQFICPPVFGENREENSNLITAMNNHENIMDIESYRRDQLNMCCAEERARMCKETAQTRISVELKSPVIGEGFPRTDMELDSYPQGKDYLSNVLHCQSLSVEEDEISTSNSNDEPMECEPSALSNIGSPETVTNVTVIHPLDGKPSSDEHSSAKVSGSDKELALRPLVEGLNLTTSTLLSKEIQVASDSDHRIASGQSITLKTVPMQSENSKKMYHNHNPLTAESYVRKSQVSKTIPRTFQGHHSFPYTNSKKAVSSTPVTKPRTWHRNAATSLPSLAPNKAFSNIVSQQKQSSEKNGKFQSTSYIRKGNSLVRKPTTVAVLAQGSDVSSTTRLKSSGVDDSKKGTGSGRIEVIDTSNVLRTGLNAMSEKPRTSTHPSSTRLPYLSTTSSGNCTPSTSAEPALSGCSEPLSEPIKFMGNGAKSSEDSLMRSATSECQSGPISNVESQSENVKRITYVKRKSNQLVVASNSFDIADKAQGVHADGGYYKKSKNQLIRTPLESQKKADDSSIFEGQKASMVIPSRIPSKKQSHKVVAKTGKPSKFSLVWTLCGALSSSKDDRSLHREFLPRTPYKRGTSWRSFMQNAAAISNNSSLTLTRKLLLSRKMNTIYTRSKHGFSLRKSKVLSVGGSSLKWSKSIERQSKMVNEEATLAVAAADKKKREQNGAAARALTRTKNKKERIFRIGSVRYRMDSSRRTLQRISDDESSLVAASQSKNNLKKSYVPRRLLIGNDEYVRIGNGNQLVRDPKKRTRALASEKVRWSLHTARSRLAKKRKYCLFFTRFGKCNKDDGKCPYIHDPSKIAVCTKFLNGFCSDPNCKLTHEVIPERMPDCSYFLQGLCTNEKCSYRHVKVNHNSPTCEGFLKGYCADGDECRKKHSYICPVFESTGSCPQGSKCKLHHPKNRGKGKKRKQQDRQNNTQGRYFGSTRTNYEPGNMVSERHIAQTSDDISFEGNFGDYISLGVVSDDEAGESNDITSGHGTFCNSSSSDLQLHDLDSLIKPIRIMA